MAELNKSNLKSQFIQGKLLTKQSLDDVVESTWNVIDNGKPVEMVISGWNMRENPNGTDEIFTYSAIEASLPAGVTFDNVIAILSVTIRMQASAIVHKTTSPFSGIGNATDLVTVRASVLSSNVLRISASSKNTSSRPSNTAVTVILLVRE